MKLKLPILCTILFILTSCIGGNKGLNVEFKNPGAIKNGESTTNEIVINSVSVSSNQLIINGTGLNAVTSAKLSHNSTVQDFIIESANSNQVIANGLSAVSIGVGKVFDLILSDAHGAGAMFQVSFAIDDHSIDLKKLKIANVSPGQILKFNGSDWIASSQTETQIYKGTWDATTTIPDVMLSNSGDYFIVSVAGGTYAIGDWIVSDGYSWTTVPYSSTSVSSFQGRKGIVSLVPADYVSLKDVSDNNKIPGSKIADIADVDLTGIGDGKILKWDAGDSKWVVADDTGGASGIARSDLSATAPLSYNNTTGVFSLETIDLLALPLTGLSSATGTVSSTDTLVVAVGKLLNTQNDYISKSGTTSMTTGELVVSGTAMIRVPKATGQTDSEVANVEYVNTRIDRNGIWAKGADPYDNTINFVSKVGIGTVTPGANLHVSGTMGSGFNGNDNTGIRLTNTPNGVTWRIASGIGGVLHSGFSIDDVTQSASRLVINTSGNVGIGTTSPSAKLDILDTILSGSGSLYGSALSLSQTWNTTGTPTALKLNVTDTSSNASSLLMDLLVGGNSKFNITKLGNVNAGVGGSIYSTLNGGSLKFTNSANSGFNAKMSMTGNEGLTFDAYGGFLFSAHKVDFSPNFQINRDHSLGWSSASNAESVSGDLKLWRDSSGVLAQRNGANSQALRFYNTFTNSTNYERGVLDWNTTLNVLQIGTEAAGTGVVRNISLVGGNVGIGTTNPLAKLDILDTTLSGSGSLNGSALRIAQTWNTTGDPTAFKLSVTDTASGNASGSRLLDITYNGTSYLNIIKGGQARFSGLITASGGLLTSGPVYLRAALPSINFGSSDETSLRLEAARTFAFRGTTNPQTLRLYGTYTDPNNYERGVLDWNGSANVLRIGTEAQGTGTVRNISLVGGNVGIGTSTPTLGPLQMASGAYVTIGGAWTNASDRRLKKNIIDSKYGLDDVLKLRPVEYIMKSSGEKQVGFIAQELKKIVPEVVSGKEGDISKGETLGVSYGNLVSIVISAVKEFYHKWFDDSQAIHRELASKADKLELEKLKAENALIKTKLERIEKILEKIQ